MLKDIFRDEYDSTVDQPISSSTVTWVKAGEIRELASHFLVCSTDSLITEMDLASEDGGREQEDISCTAPSSCS